MTGCLIFAFHNYLCCITNDIVYISVRQTVGRDPKWGCLNTLWGRFITGILHLKFLS